MSHYVDTDKAKELWSGEHPIQIAMRKIFEDLPAADVVPRSEVARLEQEIETLKDNNEHLAVMLMEAKAEVVRKIFEEIDSKILAEIDLNNGVLIEFEGANEPYHRIKGEVSALCKIQDFLAELKKKYPESEVAE